MFSGVIGPSEAARAQQQRRSEARRACAAGADGFPSLGVHLRTRAAPALRLTHRPLVLTAPHYPLRRVRRGGVEADPRTRCRPSHTQNMLGQAARPPWTSRAVVGPLAAALNHASHVLPGPTPRASRTAIEAAAALNPPRAAGQAAIARGQTPREPSAPVLCFVCGLYALQARIARESDRLSHES